MDNQQPTITYSVGGTIKVRNIPALNNYQAETLQYAISTLGCLLNTSERRLIPITFNQWADYITEYYDNPQTDYIVEFLRYLSNKSKGGE